VRYDCDTATVALQTTITEKSVKNWCADLLVAGNHKPSLKSVDEAIRRRLHLIPFVVAIPPVERDKGLTEKSPGPARGYRCIGRRTARCWLGNCAPDRPVGPAFGSSRRTGRAE